MKGMEVWLKIFNTDFEDAVLSEIGEEKNFVDEGCSHENKKIVDKLEGWTYAQLFNCYCNYHGSSGMDFATLVNIFEMLQIEDDWNKAKEGYDG